MDKRQLAIAAILTAMVLAPLLIAAPALSDYSNHVVRMALLTSPPPGAAYVSDWGIKPNLAFDAFVWLAAKAMPVEVAARLFAALALLAPVAGAVAVARAIHGRIGAVHAVAALLAYNVCFGSGLLSFLFGLGLALFGFAAWVATPWRPTIKAAAFVPLCIVLFFCHLFSLAAFGLMAGAWELGRGRLRTALPNLAALAMAAAPAFALLAAVPAGPTDIQTVTWGTLSSKLVLLTLGPVLSGVPSDATVAIVLVVGIVTLILGGRRIPLEPTLRLPLAAVFVVAAAMPTTAFGGWMVDARLPVLLGLLAVAAIPPSALPQRYAGLTLAVMLAVVGWRSFDAATQWRIQDGHVSEFRAAETVVPLGAHVLVATVGDGAAQVVHVPDWLAVDRAAFVTTLNAQPDQQPIATAPGYSGFNVGRKAFPVALHDLEQSTTAAGREAILSTLSSPWSAYRGAPWYFGWEGRFDCLVVLSGEDRAVMPGMLAEVAHGSFFRIYHITQNATVNKQGNQ